MAQELLLTEVVPFLQNDLFGELSCLFLSETARVGLFLSVLGNENSILDRDRFESACQEIA